MGLNRVVNIISILGMAISVLLLIMSDTWFEYIVLGLTFFVFLSVGLIFPSLDGDKNDED